MKRPKWKATLFLYLFELVLIGVPLYFILDINELTIEEQFRWIGVINVIIGIHTVQELKNDELKDKLKELEQNQATTNREVNRLSRKDFLKGE